MYDLWKDKTSLTEPNSQAAEVAQSYGWFLLFRRIPVRVSLHPKWVAYNHL